MAANNPLGNTFLFEIISPTGITFADNINEVTLPSTTGEITILPHHTALFTKLRDGEVKIKKGKDEILIAITGGFLEVNENKVNVLAEYAIRADSIEIAKAEEAKKRAEQILKEKVEEEDFALVEKDLQKAILELKIADKVKKRNRPS